MSAAASAGKVSRLISSVPIFAALGQGEPEFAHRCDVAHFVLTLLTVELILNSLLHCGLTFSSPFSLGTSLPHFSLSLALKLQATDYVCGDTVLGLGERSGEIFLLASGAVKVRGETEEEQAEELTAGAFNLSILSLVTTQAICCRCQ
jgi:hypothetical protein